MHVVFVTRGLQFDGNSLETGSLGGSETAAICVARELAKLGHTVRMFCSCDRPGNYAGVHYAHWQEFKTQCATLDVDVLIASRWADFLAAKVPAGLRVLWCHDILTSPDHVMPGLFQTDLLMLLSDFHIEQYAGVVPELKKHIWKTSNGVDLELVEKCKRPKVKKKLIYTSRPERGLHFLIGDILPKILEKHPDVKLYCAAYQNNLIQDGDPAKALVAESERLIAQYPNNVVPMGALTKEQLYHHISSSQLWLFPTSFCEIFCIGAAEAQACGTTVVTTNDFALKETVGQKSGILIDGLPSDPDYADRFANAVIALLDDQAKIDELASHGPEWINEAGYRWDSVAKSWTDKFEDMLFKRWHGQKDRVIRELERRSDLIPAKRLADKEGLTESVERITAKVSSAADFVEEGTIKERFRKALPRFRVLSKLSRMFGKKPKKILEWRAGDVAFGLVAAKEFPESQVTLHAIDADVHKRLEIQIERSKLTNVRVVEKLAVNDGFDLVVADQHVDTAVSPSGYLKSLMAYVNTGGLVGFTARHGATAGTFAASAPNRLWNLSQADFQQIFADPDIDYKLAFNSSGMGSGGDQLGHWIAVVRKTTSFGDPDVEGRKIRTRPYKTLAMCMITRNEEDWLLGCLKSISKIADRVVIADSKSTDSTVRIAEEFGAEVREIDFDNFSQARNASVADLDEDWVLWLDADERLIGAEHVRPFLQSEICEGFGIRQNHLMLDMEKSFDIPIRLFKNKPHYKFNGCIHEQLEDVSEKTFDVPVAPSLILPDTDIAHYGYTTESVRRQKVSNRNLELLIRDTKESDGRLFTWVFVMRDYLNFVKWYREKSGPTQEGTFPHICLEYAVSTYFAKFATCTNDRMRDLADPLLQESLKWLGMAGLCYGDNPTPPFETGITITGAVGGLEQRNAVPTTRWFVNTEEFRLFLDGKGAEMQSLLLSDNSYDKSRYLYAPPTDLPDPTPILEQGCNLFAS